MSIRLNRICELVEGELYGDPHYIINSAGPLEEAQEHQISFAEHGPHLQKLDSTRAAAVIVPRGVQNSSINIIQVDNPRLAFAKAVALLYPLTLPTRLSHTISSQIRSHSNFPPVICTFRITYS